jgi:hypothetical protein
VEGTKALEIPVVSSSQVKAKQSWYTRAVIHSTDSLIDQFIPLVFAGNKMAKLQAQGQSLSKSDEVGILVWRT